jgi:kynurenine formamidase
MCIPACSQKIAADLSRRSFLRSAVGLAAGVVAVGAAGCVPVVRQAGGATVPAPASAFGFSRVVDLTHRLTTDFPTFSGAQQLAMRQVVTIETGGYNVYEWIVNEHTGTHMDAPFHFSDGPTADELPADVLHGPLAIIEFRARAATDPDAQVLPEDIDAWETIYGELPPGAIVAMNSGWDQYVTTERFRNADAAGVMHFPGFHVDATQLLLEERNVHGIFVDTLSLDYGPSTDFPVHFSWLPAGKWGIEAIANLSDLPVAGAHVIVGGPRVAGASGGPSRIFALL